MKSKLIAMVAFAGSSTAGMAAPLVEVLDREPLPVSVFVDQHLNEPDLPQVLPESTLQQMNREAQQVDVKVYPRHLLESLLNVDRLAVADFVRRFEKEPVRETERQHREPMIQKQTKAPLLTDVDPAPVEVKVRQASLQSAPLPKSSAIQIAVTKPSGKQQTTSVKIDEDSSTLPQLTIHVASREQVVFSPSNIELNGAGKNIAIKIVGKDSQPMAVSAETSLYIRDDNIASFDKSGMVLRSKNPGETEVYFIHQGKVHVLDLVVQRAEPDLQTPEELFVLSDLDMKVAGYTPNAKIAQKVPKSPAIPDVVYPHRKDDFTTEVSRIQYSVVNLRVVDQRGRDDSDDDHPLPSIGVRIAGIDYLGKTDRVGALTIDNLPANSRFIFTFDDPYGRVRPMAKEVVTGAQGEEVDLHVKMPLNRVSSTYEEVAGAVPDMGQATLCGRIKDNRTDEAFWENIEVEVDIPAYGPFFFNKFGYLDPELQTTGDDGRFCFFNVTPGPIAISFYNQGQLLSTQITNAFRGRYSESVFYADDPLVTSGHLAARATAHEQLGPDRIHARSHKLIDMIDVVPLGTGRSMTYLDEGYVGVIGGAHAHNGRSFAVSQAGEFEQVLYALRPGEDNVMPLLPRGFIDDMSIRFQVPYYPDLGVVIAEHGDMYGQGNQAIDMRLVNLRGEPVGEGWYYDDKPSTKAIFFNLQPGQYLLMVETQDGYWLASEMVNVYSETASFVRTGSQLSRW